jgi:hypothetical protein
MKARVATERALDAATEVTRWARAGGAMNTDDLAIGH